MNVLGVDQSLTSTGAVVVNDGCLVYYEIISTDKSQGDDISRCEFVSKRLFELVNYYNVEKVNLEGLAFGACGDATRKLGGLQFLIISYIRNLTDINDVNVIAPTSMKKFACHGKANKEELFENLPSDVYCCFNEYSKSKGRFDLTDAYWLACY